MKIVSSVGNMPKVRADLARLSTSKYLNFETVVKYLNGGTKMEVDVARVIISADKAINYIIQLKETGNLITKADHIIALLCIFAEDSFGTKILSEDYYEYQEELQAHLDECKKYNYDGLQSAVEVMEYLGFSEFMQGSLYNVHFLLYNLFLVQSGLALVLEDADRTGTDLLFSMRYLVRNYAERR